LWKIDLQAKKCFKGHEVKVALLPQSSRISVPSIPVSDSPYGTAYHSVDGVAIPWIAIMIMTMHNRVHMIHR